MSTIIELKDIEKSYLMGEGHLRVLKGVDFSMQKGELVSIMGSSGSGKSTLMNIIGLLDHADSGSYILDDHEISKLAEDATAILRNKLVGFVFQQYFLLPRLTALQNVSLPLLYRNATAEDKKNLPLEMLEKVGMIDYADHRPMELSGGQQQRVAIARALVTHPAIILADEPTGALDSKIGQDVMNLFVELNEKEGVSFVLITHDPKVALQCKRAIHLKDGHVVDETIR